MKYMYIIPIIIFGIFLFLTCLNFYNRIDKKIIQRTYYFLSIIWIYSLFQNNKIDIINLFNNNIYTHNSILNNILLVGTLFFLFIVWDFLFISCKQINKLSLKGLEITTAEFDEAKQAIKCHFDDYDMLQIAVNTQYDMMINIYSYYINLEEVKNENVYKKIINDYAKFRNIKIDIYFDNDLNLDIIKNKYNMDDISFGSIYYSLYKYGICIPYLYDESINEEIYAIITTSFTCDDLLLVIKGKQLLKYENLILQNLISYFDSIVELEAYKNHFENTNGVT